MSHETDLSGSIRYSMVIICNDGAMLGRDILLRPKRYHNEMTFKLPNDDEERDVCTPLLMLLLTVQLASVGG